jgi:hypothetical protein
MRLVQLWNSESILDSRSILLPNPSTVSVIPLVVIAIPTETLPDFPTITVQELRVGVPIQLGFSGLTEPYFVEEGVLVKQALLDSFVPKEFEDNGTGNSVDVLF